MSRIYGRLIIGDERLFYWCNQKFHHTLLDQFLRLISHLGSAAFTVICTLSIALFAEQPWVSVGWQSFVALSVSHLVAVAVKKKAQRQRPYLVLANANVVIKPLPDHSFPSGHTTAAFSAIVPFLLAAPGIAYLAIPIAVLVGFSRIYLGVHYPSDCIAGFLIGTSVALMVVQLFG
jgi:undecaprenyl-diphosphatase